MRAWAYKAGASGLAMTIAVGGVLAVTEIGRPGGTLPGVPPVAAGPPSAVAGSAARGQPQPPRRSAAGSRPAPGGNTAPGPRLVAAIAPSPQAGTPPVSGPAAPTVPPASPGTSPPGTPEPPATSGSPTPAQCLLTLNVIGVTACVPGKTGS